MAHAFDGYSFGRCLGDAERLVTRALAHEERLAQLATLLEGNHCGETVAADVALPSTAYQLAALSIRPEAHGPDLLATIHLLGTAAREQRQLAETLLARFVGAAAVTRRVPHQARVLVVDDSENSRDMTATILDDAGFDAMTAANGLEGVIVAHYALPSVILMDVTMPVLNGLEAARLIRTSPVTQNLKVIAYTAKPDMYDGRSFEKWFDDIVTKPSNPDAIVGAVQRFVSPLR
jgi:CheY-like chemotaxis protein